MMEFLARVLILDKVVLSLMDSGTPSSRHRGY